MKQRTPLMYAVTQQDTAVMEVLLEHPLRLDAVDRQQRCVAQIAAAEGPLESLIWCIDRLGVPIDYPGISGETLLQCAIGAGRVENAEWLRLKGAQLKNWSPHADGPIHLAARSGSVDMIRWCQQHYPDSVNSQTVMARTPLMIAAIEGHVDAVRYLLTAGASTTTMGFDGCRAVDLARKRGRTEIVNLLQDESIRRRLADNRGRLLG